MYSAYKLSKQSDSIQPWCTPFSFWNQSVVPCPSLNVASRPAYRFLSRQVRGSAIPISFKNFPQFFVTHTVKGFGVVNNAEVDVFLVFSCFLDDPTDVGNLISGFSAFSASSLIVKNFMVHVLLKPGLENFEHYFTSVCVCVCVCVCLLVTQSCLTLCDPMNFSPPGFSVHGILQARILEPGVSVHGIVQARILEWIAIPFSRGSS